jgi:hypothetical protein
MGLCHGLFNYHFGRFQLVVVTMPLLAAILVPEMVNGSTRKQYFCVILILREV